MKKSSPKAIHKPQEKAEENYWYVFIYGCDVNSQKIVNICLQRLIERGCVLINENACE